MAIKIIKNTMIDPIKMTCECCKSEFEYNYEDIKKTEYHDILYITRSHRSVTCPVCKYDNELDTIVVKEEVEE